jgi:hypothetical protein
MHCHSAGWHCGRVVALTASLVLLGGAVLAMFVLRRVSLRSRLQRLGNVVGLSEAQVVQALGEPRRRTVHPNCSLLVWGKRGHTVVLAFSLNGACRGVRFEQIGDRRSVGRGLASHRPL